MSKIVPDLSVVTSVGLDLAKHVFQVHCVDASGTVVAARALRRRELLAFFAALPRCLVGMEACGSAHHWGRELSALGHAVKLIPPAYVKPFVKRRQFRGHNSGDTILITHPQTRNSIPPNKGRIALPPSTGIW